MKSVLVQFIDSAVSDVYRVVHTAHLIQNHFYHINQFLVLPDYESKLLSPQIILFPDLDYAKVPRFWDRVKHVDTGRVMSNQVDEVLLGSLKEMLPESRTRPAFKQLRRKWEVIADDLLSQLNLLFPHHMIELEKIEIHLSHWGSICSFNSVSAKQPVLEVYLRDDANLYNLVEAIVSALIHDEVTGEYAGNWSEKELLIDWLVGGTVLKQIIASVEEGEHKATIQHLRKPNNIKLHQQSNVYLAKLGFKYGRSLLEVKADRIIHDGQPLRELSQRETKILKLLVTNGQISHDELADIVFADPDEFSLYALNKVMQRLRDKLEFNGICGSYIKTLRGVGYGL